MILIWISQIADSFGKADFVSTILLFVIFLLMLGIVKFEEELGLSSMWHVLLAVFLYIANRWISNNKKSQLPAEKQDGNPKKENKKKENLPPVLDDKKKKASKKGKRFAKKGAGKENKEPTVLKEKTKMYDSINASQQLNMTHKDIYMELLKYKLTEKELLMNCYPSKDYTPKNLAPAYSDFRTCVRCGDFFKVSNGQYVASSNCWYHPKKAPQSLERRHPCCDKAWGETGCTEFPYHVTVQHGPIPLTQTASRRHVRKDLQHRVFSLDCEMSFTTGGLEVTRIALVDIDGLTMYDTYVKPKNEILDYNTQYSGVEKRHLEHLTITLDDVKKILNNFIHEDTVLVGHALNNDLAALGLIHKTVVDTSVLYPNVLNPRQKRSLRSLAAELLNLSIQSDQSGHNCIDDARACLQLALLKIPPNPPSKPLNPIENAVVEQPLHESKKNLYKLEKQQSLMLVQDFHYPPLAFTNNNLFKYDPPNRERRFLNEQYQYFNDGLWYPPLMKSI